MLPTVDIVFKDRRFVNCREVPIVIWLDLHIRVANAKAYPLVKTFNKLVFPQAPSPLRNWVSFLSSRLPAN
jgi:hypothetical protein